MEYLDKGYGERNARNVDGTIQVELLEDEGSSTRESWMKTSGLWTLGSKSRKS